MSKQDTSIDLMIEELNACRNVVEKQMVLQKYGAIEPKLTELELASIEYEKNPIAYMSKIGWVDSEFIYTPPTKGYLEMHYE